MAQPPLLDFLLQAVREGGTEVEDTEMAETEAAVEEQAQHMDIQTAEVLVEQMAQTEVEQRAALDKGVRHGSLAKAPIRCTQAEVEAPEALEALVVAEREAQTRLREPLILVAAVAGVTLVHDPAHLAALASYLSGT